MNTNLQPIRDSLIDLLVGIGSKKQRKKIAQLLTELNEFIDNEKQFNKEKLTSFLYKLTKVVKKIPEIYLEHQAFEFVNRTLGL